MSGMTLSCISPIRNPQRPPSTHLLDPPSWHTSNWDINTKFSGFLPRGKKTSFMTSGMTRSSMSPVRNPQHPPSTPLIEPPPSWHTSNKDINTKFSGFLSWGIKIIHDVRNDPVLHVSCQEPSTSSKYRPSCPHLLDTLLIEISAQNFQGIFLGAYLNHP